MNNKKTRHSRIDKLEAQKQRLSYQLNACQQMNEILSNNLEDREKQRVAYRRLLKYHTLVLIIMNLVCQYTESNDMGRVIRANINRYYKGLTSDLMNIPGDDMIDNLDEELENENEG